MKGLQNIYPEKSNKFLVLSYIEDLLINFLQTPSFSDLCTDFSAVSLDNIIKHAQAHVHNITRLTYVTLHTHTLDNMWSMLQSHGVGGIINRHGWSVNHPIYLSNLKTCTTTYIHMYACMCARACVCAHARTHTRHFYVCFTVISYCRKTLGPVGTWWCPDWNEW